MAPPTEHVMGPDGATREIPAADVRIGDRVLVKPGERVSVDGAVRRGVSHVNQAPIMSESLPVEQGEGAEVFAGTIYGRRQLRGSTATRTGSPAGPGPTGGGLHASGNGITQSFRRTEGTSGSVARGYCVRVLDR